MRSFRNTNAFPLHLPALLVWFALGMTASAGDDADRSAALRAEAERVLHLGKSEARSRLDIAIRHAEHLRQEGQARTALQWLDRILKVDPWAMRARLMVAEIGREQASTPAWRKQAEWILDHALADHVRVGALYLLDRPVDTSIPAMQRVPGAGVTIVLVPIGKVDALLLKAVAEEAGRYLPFPVLLQDARLPLPRPARNPFGPRIDRLRSGFRRALDSPGGRRVLAEHGKTVRDLESDAVFLDVYRTWLESGGRWRELSDLDEGLRRRHRPAWPANDLMKHLASVLGRHGRDNVSYIGVTRGEIYAGPQERALFGWGGKEIGIVSYARFLPRLTGEEPDWNKLRERTTKQVICTAGSTFEVGTCEDRGCPMRIVFEVSRRDACRLTPCEACRRRMLRPERR